MKLPDKVIIEITGDTIATRVYAEGEVVSSREANPLDRGSVGELLNDKGIDIGPSFRYLDAAIDDAVLRAPDIAEALRDLR